VGDNTGAESAANPTEAADALEADFAANLAAVRALELDEDEMPLTFSPL
jgi:hypothetical protein